MSASLPLQGITVVTVEQAVAAPFASSRLADAGAHVIKIERPEGDFARGYDDVAKGQSSYFVWLNRGKESVIIDLASDSGKAELAADSKVKLESGSGIVGITEDPGPWEGEQRNMWKPTRQEALWFHGGNLHQSRHYSQFLSLQLKARMEGIPTPVYGLQEVHHLGR